MSVRKFLMEGRSNTYFDFSKVEILKGPIGEDEAEALADQLYAAMSR